jgi:outer membrane protein assembly factor BamB
VTDVVVGGSQFIKITMPYVVVRVCLCVSGASPHTRVSRSVTCYSVSSGAQLWAANLTYSSGPASGRVIFASSPTVSGNGLVLIAAAGWAEVFALDLQTGGIVYAFNPTPPSAANQYDQICEWARRCEPNSLICVSAMAPSINPVTGDLVIATNDGWLYTFGKSGAPC